MQQTQVSRVLKMVATLKGGRLPQDRQRLLGQINSVRQMLWNNEAFREGACRNDGCAIVECFREACRNCSCKPIIYTGIVLPPGVTNITELLRDGQEVEIQYGRLDPDGCCNKCYNCLTAELLPQRLLERDTPWDSNGRIVFHCDDPADTGLPVGVRYVDFAGREHRQDLELSESGVVTEVSVLQFLEITFPERCGWIRVRTEEGHPLGRYHPSIFVPKHTHFRIIGSNPGEAFMWKGLQEPYDLVFDSDPVEFSDLPKWKICLALEELLSQVEMTSGQRSGEANLTAKLAAFFASDLSAQNKTFSGRLMPRSRAAMFGAGMLFSGTRRF